MIQQGSDGWYANDEWTYSRKGRHQCKYICNILNTFLFSTCAALDAKSVQYNIFF